MARYYDKENYLQSLREAYKDELRKDFDPEFRDLRRKIIKINKITRRANDYTQSKYYFKKKVGGRVLVPATYYFGDDLERIRQCLLDFDEFVLKPNHLSQGIGVRVLQRKDDIFEDINGEKLTVEDLIEECREILKVKRFEAERKILIEERIQSPSVFSVYRNALADIRMIFYQNEFMWCVARLPTEQSAGYGSRCRGAEVGFVLDDGYFVKGDARFNNGLYREGQLPYFDELVDTGKAVTELFGIAFQSVDMTINSKGDVVVIESEYLPMLENTLTLSGVRWLDALVSKDFNLSRFRYKSSYAYRLAMNELQKIIFRYPKDF